MKICPQCQTSYTDDSLRFCLQDGSPLTDQAPLGSWGETETVVKPRQTEKVKAGQTNAQSQNWTESAKVIPPELQRKSNTPWIVTLTVLLTILAIGAGAFGVWYFTRSGKTEVARNVNAKPVNAVVPNVSNTNQPDNANTNTNINTNINPTPTVTPVPKPSLNSREIKDIQSDVKDVVEDWKDALENLDLNAHLGSYADTVDYYRAGKIGIREVRADKQRAFEAYDSIDIDISNLKITPDETGENASALFDKKWNFEGAGSYSSGKVQQQLQLTKVGGRWLISAEKDLQVYYINK